LQSNPISAESRGFSSTSRHVKQNNHCLDCLVPRYMPCTFHCQISVNFSTFNFNSAVVMCAGCCLVVNTRHQTRALVDMCKAIIVIVLDLATIIYFVSLAGENLQIYSTCFKAPFGVTVFFLHINLIQSRTTSPLQDSLTPKTLQHRLTATPHVICHRYRTYPLRRVWAFMELDRHAIRSCQMSGLKMCLSVGVIAFQKQLMSLIG